MSAFYCHYHQRMEDSDRVGFNPIKLKDGGDVYYCDDAYWDTQTVIEEMFEKFYEILRSNKDV